MGGVIFNMQGSVTISNSTLEGNSAIGGTVAASSAATPGDGLGGAIFNLNGSVSLTNATVDTNTAAQGGGGVYDLDYDSATARTASVTLIDSILYGSVGGVTDLVSNAPASTVAGANEGTASVAATETNIVESSTTLSSSGTITGSPSTANPDLGTLADNGGPGMETQLPGAGGGAIGAGTCVVTVDERGDPRPTPGQTNCDLGAVQTHPAPACANISVAVPYGTPTAVQLSCTVGALTYSAPGAPSHGSLSGFNAATGMVTYTPAAGYAGQDSFTYSALNDTGASNTAKVTVTVAATVRPVSTAPPTISGTPTAGTTLHCSPGAWTNDPTSYAYQWSRDGTPIAGATTDTYTVQTGDEGLTITCAVAAINAGGVGTPATSKGAPVAVPYVPRCPAATGKLSGGTLGLVRLGMTRAQAQKAFTHSSDRGKRYQDFFCLTPIGVRVGYASPKLLAKLSGRERTQLKGRVVWASTSSGYYALNGIRPGATVSEAGKHLKLEAPFHIGLNYWYLASDGAVTAVLKVRRAIVQEIGIADRQITQGRRAQRAFLTSFS